MSSASETGLGTITPFSVERNASTGTWIIYIHLTPPARPDIEIRWPDVTSTQFVEPPGLQPGAGTNVLVQVLGPMGGVTEPSGAPGPVYLVEVGVHHDGPAEATVTLFPSWYTPVTLGPFVDVNR